MVERLSMFAYVNDREHADGVTLREVAEPAPAPSEAIVAVETFSLNRGELALIARRPSGWRPGQDIAGVVVRPASDGRGPTQGARVAGLVDGAGWSERVAAPVSRLAELPDGLGFVAAAALPLAGLTALRLVRLGGPLLGRALLVTGAAGGVGQLAVQLAHLAGANVTAVASRDNAERLSSLGARQVVTSTAEAGGRFDVILESVGGRSMDAAVKCVAPGGLILSFGNSSGEKAAYDLLDFFGAENAAIRTFFSYASGPEQAVAPDLATLVGLASSERLKAPVDTVRPWRDLPVMLDALRRRDLHGKAILRVD